jgi:hypothetical protein
MAHGFLGSLDYHSEGRLGKYLAFSAQTTSVLNGERKEITPKAYYGFSWTVNFAGSETSLKQNTTLLG